MSTAEPSVSSTSWNLDSSSSEINRKKRPAPPPRLSPLEVTSTMTRDDDNNCGESAAADGEPLLLCSACPRHPRRTMTTTTPLCGGVSSHEETPIAGNHRRRGNCGGGIAAQFFLFPSSALSRKKPRKGVQTPAPTASCAAAGRHHSRHHRRRPFDRLQAMLDSLALSTSSSSSFSSSNSSLSSAAKTAKATNVSAAPKTTRTSRSKTTISQALFSCAAAPDDDHGAAGSATGLFSSTTNARLEKERQHDWDLSVPTTDLPTTLRRFDVEAFSRPPSRRGKVLHDNDPNVGASMGLAALSWTGSTDAVVAGHGSTSSSSSHATEKPRGTCTSRTSAASSPHAAPSRQGRRASSAPIRGDRTRRVIDSIIQNS